MTAGRRPPFPPALLAALVALPLLAAAPRARADITLAVDAREAPRGILHVKETLPARPGPLSLSYPKWIPGEHGPTGPNTDVAGLYVRAGGQTLAWRRDLVDMYTIAFEVPPGASSVELSFDFLLSTSTVGYSSASAGTPSLLLLSWNQVSMYPAGEPSDKLTFDASAQLPAGWKFATALGVQSQAGGTLRFAPVSYTNLVDSPVLAGEHFRSVDLSPGETPAHHLDMACDGEGGLAIPDASVAALRRLVKEAYALFGARHYRHYDFLLTLSDHTAHFGLEHHQSSDDRVDERTWVDDDLRLEHSTLLPHEYVHSWNGKFRRPAGLATPDYQEPMKGDLLWVYEGLTSYLAWVLGGRAETRTLAQSYEDLARIAAGMESHRGRAWRPLQDTADEAQLLYDSRPAWQAFRRGTDFYDEGVLDWLAADVTIRRLSNGARSLDDFCKRFHGGPNNGPEIKPYTFDEVVRTLNEVQPYDWAGFWHRRLTQPGEHAPVDGITDGGWRLTYGDSMSSVLHAGDEGNDRVTETWSIGLSVNKDGMIRDVVPGSAADKAGISPDMKLIAVNGRAYDKHRLHDAIAATRAGAPLELLVENADTYAAHKLEYKDGLRYPKLERMSSARDWLGEILKPQSR
ncbi:MAG TPA: PDZ domain-containing protein [Candidatus Eisenbacteria bacterium]|nr:PDZ domain-containing protein [Candidatus Eisenbacteria bacterium]